MIPNDATHQMRVLEILAPSFEMDKQFCIKNCVCSAMRRRRIFSSE